MSRLGSRASAPTEPALNSWYYKSSEVPGTIFQYSWVTAAEFAPTGVAGVIRAKFTKISPHHLTIMVEAYKDGFRRDYVDFQVTITRSAFTEHSPDLPPRK